MGRIFRELPIPNDINKIVCFGLGSFSDRWRPLSGPEDPRGRNPNPDPYPLRIQHHHQAMLWTRLLKDRFGHGVKLYAQDPEYTFLDQRILEDNGFTIVGRHGAGGFAMVDRQTLVFSVFCEANTREIVFEITRPAMMVINRRFGGPSPPDEAAQIASLDYEIPSGDPVVFGTVKYLCR